MKPVTKMSVFILILPVFIKGKELMQLTHNLSLPSGYSILWNSGDPEWITFQISAPTRGYLALGFSPNGNMAASDIYIGWVDSKGQGYIKDYFATGNGQPTIDPKQDIQLLSASETDFGTSIVFKRRWDTCDQRDFIIGEDTMRLIWAWSDDDPVELNGQHIIPYHEKDIKKRGVRTIFMKTKPKQRTFPDEETIYPQHMQHLDLILSNVKVPALETYRHCKIVKFQKLSQKHHIIAYRPIIGEESSPYVRHINIFSCQVPQNLGFSEEDIFERYVDHPGGDCYTSEAPTEWTDYCSQFRVVVGVGSEGVILPDHLGDGIGSLTKSTFYRLEVHYENPTGKFLLDSSGIRIFYTSKLREFETGLLHTGHRRTPFLSIPPGQNEFINSGFCSAECTRNGFGPEGIKAVAVLLHTHLAGRKIILRHIRNGRELPPIAYDNAIDPNYQHYRMLAEEVKILPGDEIITECTFDTSANKTFVFGGLSMRRETCESFIIYYPKSSLVDCRSQPEFYQYLGALGIMNATGDILQKLNLPFNLSTNNMNDRGDLPLLDDSIVLETGSVISDIFKDILITNPQRLRNRFIHDHMLSLQWNDDFFAKLVEQKWRVGPHYMHCSASAGRTILAKQVVGFPRYLEHMEEMTPDSKTCLIHTDTNIASSNILNWNHYFFIILLIPLRFSLL